MASHRDLSLEWCSLLQERSNNPCDSTDLQLAAELGKTLLERNKELETSLKQHQNIIEDQTQEIEYLTKQTAALREVNDSRLRIYEQLEIGIQDLERTNQRLALENANDKKQIKSLCLTIDSLEAKCEELHALEPKCDELQRTLEEVQQQRLKRPQGSDGTTASKPENSSPDKSVKRVVENKVKANGLEPSSTTEADEVVQLLGQIRELKHQRTKEQRKVLDLEEQLAAVVQENVNLEEKLNIMQQKEDDMKSLQEEMLTLEEVRQGQLCRRCLRAIDTRGQDELSLVMDREDDDISVVNSVTSDTHSTMSQLPTMEEHHDNPYRILVEKYEALLEMQRHPVSRQHSSATSNNCLSLQEELQMSGDFNSFTKKEEPESDPEPEPNETNKASEGQRARKTNGSNVTDKPLSSTTPTDFSEAETSSSGFSDETSIKETQTEGYLFPPGSFLCSIADGDDCRFSIYDDASPIESRFRKTPEYRQLFREIFAVLKRAAEAKEEGEQLPLLEDATPVTEMPKVPPATPAKEEQPSNFSANSRVPEKAKESTASPTEKSKKSTVSKSNSNGELKSPGSSDNTTTSESQGSDNSKDKSLETVDTKPEPAPKRDYLECLSAGVGKKKSRKNSPMKNLKASMQERVQRLEHLNTIGIGMSFSNRSYRKRKDPRNADYNSDRCASPSSTSSSGRKDDSHRRSYPQSSYDSSQSVLDGQTYPSAASQEVAKLKRLEKSYAEVLRLGPQKTSRPHYRK